MLYHFENQVTYNQGHACDKQSLGLSTELIRSNVWPQ